MKTKILLLIPFFIGIHACQTDVDPANNEVAALTTYAEIVAATYQDTYQSAITLKEAIQAFTTNPTEKGFETCKLAWKASRIPYGQSEAFRFYGGPIDDENGPEGLINGWPLDESYIDYVAGNPEAGIINNPASYPLITKELLISLNESGSETDISTGYHAIEFLLWGQDFNPNGPGQRKFTDYTTARFAPRRSSYLLATADLLVENLSFVTSQWTAKGDYRQQFISSTNTAQKITDVFTGIGILAKGELAGERMTVALANQDQEDEQSCFSDNTHIDIIMNFMGIKNVYLGTYTSTGGQIITGYSLSELVKSKDQVKDQAVLNALLSTESKVNAILPPFDQLIAMGDPDQVITKAIDALRQLSDRFADAAFLWRKNGQ